MYKYFVGRGARLLDQENPSWYENVDTNLLRQHSVYGCVLGQLYGDYDNGLDALESSTGKNMRNGWTHGFNAFGSGVFTFGGQAKYNKLTSYWIDEINLRRTTAA